MNPSGIETGKSQFLLGISILFWGYASDLLWFALPMAAVAETRFYFNRRWALQKLDFYRIADLTSVGLLALILFLFLNRQEYHFITTLLAWLPILIFPLVTVLAYSTTPRMPLDVLFYSLRRQREPLQQSWDMNYVLMGSCLLAAGLSRENPFYFIITTAIILIALYRLRSSRFSRTLFLASMGIVLVASTILHTGMREAHLELKAKTEQWIANWISQRTDPMKTRTAIGQVGRLKLSDAIAFRVVPASGEPDFPPHLIEAVYNSPSGLDWEVFDPRFNTVPAADDFRWWFSEDPLTSPEAQIYLEFDRENTLVPVPGELTEIYELAAIEVTQSIYGTIQGKGLIPAPYYRVRYDNEVRLGAPPTKIDLFLPPEYSELMEEVLPAKNIRPSSRSPDLNAISEIQSYFEPFSYSLYQDLQNVTENPMGHFLKTSRRGHCEYFASATALMLRHLGIPSRYVVGYAVKEWNDSMGLYTVRQRHAHAWAVGYINGQWVPIDTTPSVWFDMEEEQSGFMQPLWDSFGNTQFAFQRWWQKQKLEDYEMELYLIGGLLALVLVWRIFTSEQVILKTAPDSEIQALIKPGASSPFFKIESYLQSLGFQRGPGELMRQWLIRIDKPELLPLLADHNRWRFDPRGLSDATKKQLASEVLAWLQLNEHRSQGTKENSKHAGGH